MIQNEFIPTQCNHHMFVCVCVWYRMKEEREERIGLKESGDLPLDAPDVVPENQLFKGRIVQSPQLSLQT